MTSARPVSKSIDDALSPTPPRYKWLKRIAAGALALLVALFILRALAVHRAQAELDGVIAAIHTRGGPVQFDAFKGPAIPDAQNGALVLRQALGVLTRRDPNVEGFNHIGEEMENRDQPIVDDWVRANSASLALLRQARSMSSSDWNWVDPNWVNDHFNFQPYRDLERLAWHAADLAAREGNVIAFVEYLRDEMAIHRILSAGPQAQFQYEALFALLRVLKAIEEDGERLVAQLGDAASRQCVREFTAELLDGAAIQTTFRRLVERQRASAIYLMQHRNVAETLEPKTPLAKRSWDRAMLYLFRVRIIRSQTVTLDRLNAMEASLNQASSPGARFTEARSPRIAIDAVDTQLSVFENANDSDLHDLMFKRDLMHCRMAAIDLAIRLYQSNHGGQSIARLEDLVPTYLSSLPIDPFSPSRSTFSFDMNRRWLYSEKQQEFSRSTQSLEYQFYVGND